MASKKLPSWQFYPGDWMKDTELRSVSPAARGMWIDLLCLMFESRRRGFLLVNGTPPTLDQIARMTGFLSIHEATVCLTELETSGVFSRTDPNKDGDALIYCRRMVRDEAKRNICRENGGKGGNPKLKSKRERVATSDNQNYNQPSNQDPNPKGTTSSSTSVKKSLSPARVRDGEEEREMPQPEDDMPDSLIRVGEAVISPMPIHQLRILVLDGFPPAWIEKAILEAGRREIKGKRAVDYARRILQEWTKNGSPDDDNPNTGRNPPRTNAPKTGNREPPDFSDVRTGEAL